MPQDKVNSDQAGRNIAKYACTLVGISEDTISLSDSLHVRLEFSLDCTNQITSFEPAFDTLEGVMWVHLSVFGTVYKGPYRPLCPATIVDKDFAFLFPGRGVWRIDSGRPIDEAQGRDTVSVVVR